MAARCSGKEKPRLTPQWRSNEMTRLVQPRNSAEMRGKGVLRKSQDRTGNAKAKISNETKCGGLALACAAVE